MWVIKTSYGDFRCDNWVFGNDDEIPKTFLVLYKLSKGDLGLEELPKNKPFAVIPTNSIYFILFEEKTIEEYSKS